MSALTRRRFLSISACMVLAGSTRDQPRLPRTRWQGTALGADVSITLRGPDALTRPLLARLRLEIEAYESRFSLFRADSDITRLNREGHLPDLDARWQDMIARSNRLYHATGGLFDPTIQPLWLAYATGGDIDAARAQVGWDRVALPGPARRGLRLGEGQALSLNGIAQGAATDAVKALLQTAGLTQVMVDIGETATIGGPWNLGLSDPEHGSFATLQLQDKAMAVSSPAALRLGPTADHILHPIRATPPRWASIAVVADRAADADGLSTAGCFMTRTELRRGAMQLGGIEQILLLDAQGVRQTVSIPA